jgi:Leucine-rich repeat (LRR) protein
VNFALIRFLLLVVLLGFELWNCQEPPPVNPAMNGQPGYSQQGYAQQNYGYQNTWQNQNSSSSDSEESTAEEQQPEGDQKSEESSDQPGGALNNLNRNQVEADVPEEEPLVVKRSGVKGTKDDCNPKNRAKEDKFRYDFCEKEIEHLNKNEKITIELVKEKLIEEELWSSECSCPKVFNELSQIKKLNLKAMKLQEVGPLTVFSELEELDLSDNEVADLSPLSKLTKLKNLKLAGNRFLTIDALSALKQITDLDLSRNRILSVNALTSLRSLSSLNIMQTPVKSVVSIIEAFPKIQIQAESTVTKEIRLQEGAKPQEKDCGFDGFNMNTVGCAITPIMNTNINDVDLTRDL